MWSLQSVKAMPSSWWWAAVSLRVTRRSHFQQWRVSQPPHFLCEPLDMRRCHLYRWCAAPGALFMAAERANPYVDELRLFDPEPYWREPELVMVAPAEPDPPTMPTDQQQLGWDNNHRGAIAHAEFEARMVRLGASPSRPTSDPGGG